MQAHEIGHQWFGNLVTQASWDDVWLSEGFATWISAKMMDQEQPPERVHLAAIAARERMMAVDNPARSRPVRVAVNSRETARDVYNRVVYDKGAAILLMLEGWLGEDRFRDGLRAYLNEHRFGNATTDDLVAALRAASGKDPSRVLNTFLNTTGVPELRGQVALRSRCRPPLARDQIEPRLGSGVLASRPGGVVMHRAGRAVHRNRAAHGNRLPGVVLSEFGRDGILPDSAGLKPLAGAARTFGRRAADSGVRSSRQQECFGAGGARASRVGCGPGNRYCGAGGATVSTQISVSAVRSHGASVAEAVKASVPPRSSRFCRHRRTNRNPNVPVATQTSALAI